MIRRDYKSRKGIEYAKEWYAKLQYHKRADVRKKYLEKEGPAGWGKKKDEINNHYNKLIKVVEDEAKKQLLFEDKYLKEYGRLYKLSVKNGTNPPVYNPPVYTATVKRSPVGKSSKRSPKGTRCPNGTRKNKKTGKCDPKK